MSAPEGGWGGPDPAGGRALRLRYGLNGTVYPERFRELGTHAVRLSVFDDRAPDPLGDWGPFASCVQAVLDAGAAPMITFARFGPPYDDAGAVRSFAGRCAGVVAACVRRWRGEAVRAWYWCVWH